MNNFYLFFVLLMFNACMHAQKQSLCEAYSADASYAYYSDQSPFMLLSGGNAKNRDMRSEGASHNLHSGWSSQQSCNPNNQSCNCPPFSSRQASIASICGTWGEQRFAQEIERSIAWCMVCGYSREYAEQQILEQHVLYMFPSFIKNIKKLSGYRSYIKELYQKLLNNQNCFYPLLKVLGGISSGYKQLLAITEQLYKEILEQEKVEEKKQKIISQQHNRHVTKQKNLQVNHENVQKTFDEQYEDLMHEADEWQALLDIDQEECKNHTVRIERRLHILHEINNGQITYSEKAYTLSSSAIKLLQNVGSDSVLYTKHYENQLQQSIHQECIDGIERVVTMHPSVALYSYQRGIVECFDAARTYNQKGLTHKASVVTDFCWTLLDCGLAIAEGAVDGVIGAVKDTIEHPVQAVVCAVAGPYVLAYQLSKVLYNVADIGITALDNPEQALQQWDDYIAPITQLIDAIYNRQIMVRDALKVTTHCVVQWKTQDRLLKGLSTICAVAKTKAIEFAKNNPKVKPQEYITTPDGLIFKSIHKVQPAGSHVKYERSSKFFVANHEEITALVDSAHKSMQPSQETLQAFGCGAFNTPESFLKHIFAAELKEKRFFTGEIERSLSGFHHFIADYLETMGIKLIGTRVCEKTGIIIADVLCDGHLERKKTFFPSSWSRAEVIKKVGEAMQNPVECPVLNGTRVSWLGQTEEGIIVRIVADIKSKNYITVYPDARANNLI